MGKRWVFLILIAGLSGCAGEDSESGLVYNPHTSSLPSSESGPAGPLQGVTDPNTSADTTTTTSTPPVGTSGKSCTFSPDKVYLWGTFQPGSGEVDALTDPRTPESSCVGSDHYAYQAQIHPTTHALYYLTHHEGSGWVLRKFVADDLVWNSASKRWDYPADPNANDPQITPDGCAVLSWFGFAPDDGTLFYRCFDSNRYYLEGQAETIDVQSGVVRAVGNGHRLFVTGATGKNSVMIIDGALAIELSDEGLSKSSQILTARGVDDGFLVVARVAGESDGADVLWHVAFDGKTTLRGAYPDFPGTLWPRSGGVLGKNGVLYSITYKKDVILDVIVTRTVGGTTEVIYDEGNAPKGSWWSDRNWPYVRMHGSTLFTGS